MKNSDLLKGLALLALIFSLCKNAKAQDGPIRIEQRVDTIWLAPDIAECEGYRFTLDTVRIEVFAPVGEEPATICAYDTNGDGYLDESRNDSESCAKALAEGREATSIASEKKAEPFKHNEVQYLIKKKR